MILPKIMWSIIPGLESNFLSTDLSSTSLSFFRLFVCCKACICFRVNDANIFCCSYDSNWLFGYIFAINASKFGSGRNDLFDISFLRHVGHSLLPLRNAVMIHSWQKRCKHYSTVMTAHWVITSPLTSLVVIVVLRRSKHIGHNNSLSKLRGDAAIFVESVIISCGHRWTSYWLSSGGHSSNIISYVLMAGVAIATYYR